VGLIDTLSGATTAAVRAAAEWVTKSDDDVPFREMQDALVKAGVAEPTEEKPRGLFHDPYAVMDWGGWRQRPSALTYDTLRQMTISNTVITAIIQTRVNQVAQFARPQQGPYDKGYRIILRDRRDKKKVMSKVEEKRANEIERMLETTGFLLPDETPRDRDSFRAFSKKFTRDALTYDQACFEILRDRTKKPSRFIMLPSETIRPAVNDVEHMEPEERRSRVSHVQIYEDTVIAEFGADDIAWCVMNPRSDLRVNSFGYSFVEQIMRLVTAWLYGFEYNCFTAESLVTTDRGLVPIGDLDGESFRIHDGMRWQDARAYATERKPVVRTRLWNGLELRSSPEHRFRVIPKESETGEPEWRRQKQLKQGDAVLVAYRRSDCRIDLDAFKVGQIYAGGRSSASDFTPTKELIEDTAFWEMIGFALGDGYWPSGRTGWMGLFPHHTKEAPLFDRFLAICDRHGIQAVRKQINEHHTRVTDGVRGYPIIRISHMAFVRWLYDLGFRPSNEERCIPTLFFRQPAWIRDALLRGLFTADGSTNTHESGYRTPGVASVSRSFRQDILRCLWSVGVAANEVGVGWDRGPLINIQDIPAFVEQIGFLDDYKSENITRRSPDRWDVLHPATAKAVCLKLQEHPNWLQLSLKHRGRVSAVLTAGSGLSRPVAISMFKDLSIEIPEALSYCHVEVDVTDAKPTHHEQMFDVEVMNDRHLFVANHMAVANTRFFTQGSAIKGILNVKGAIPDRQLRAFRRMWYSMVSGVQNAWKTPILNSEDIQWVNMHSANREMEYSAWMDWLTKLECAVFGIDPIEIGFVFGSAGSGGGSSMFERRPNQSEVTESKDKGLRPLVDHITDNINQHLIWELEEDFEFSFSGLDAKAEEKEREARLQEVKSYKTLDEIRAEMDEPPMPKGLGGLVLDPTYLQWAMSKEQQPSPGGEEEGSQGQKLMTPGEEEEPGGGNEGEEEEEPVEPEEGEEAAEKSQREAIVASRHVRRIFDELKKSTRTETVTNKRRTIDIIPER
jgi:Phage portal protein/LAGLIDADG-like domain